MTVGNRWKLEALPRQTGNPVCVVAEQEVLPTRVQCSQQDSAGRRGCLDRWFVSSGIHINAKTQASSALRCAAVLLAWFVVMRKQKTSIYLSIYYCYYYYEFALFKPPHLLNLPDTHLQPLTKILSKCIFLHFI